LVAAGGDGGDDAAVDEEVGAGDEGAGATRQECCGGSDLVRVPTRPAAEALIIRW
jgi:hypothetical protein